MLLLPTSHFSLLTRAEGSDDGARRRRTDDPPECSQGGVTCDMRRATEPSNESPSVVIRRHPASSGVIHRHPSSSVVIRRHPSSSEEEEVMLPASDLRVE